MKAITVKQPWAKLIVSGVKDIENRTWKTNYRGTILIHAGNDKKNTLDILNEQRFLALCKSSIARYFVNKLHQNWNRGEIIGSVEIIDCVINHPSIWADKSEFDEYEANKVGADNQKPTYNWVLANPVCFSKPIPAKGKLSFWDFDLHDYAE